MSKSLYDLMTEKDWKSIPVCGEESSLHIYNGVLYFWTCCDGQEWDIPVKKVTE